MKQIHALDMERLRSRMPPGYWDEVISPAIREGIATIDEAYEHRRKQYLQRVYPPKALNEQRAIARDQWPIWAKALAKFSTNEDKGIGDVVARIIGDENSAKFKAWHLATFGRACGCNGRQKRLNMQYPLP